MTGRSRGAAGTKYQLVYGEVDARPERNPRRPPVAEPCRGHAKCTRIPPRCGRSGPPHPRPLASTLCGSAPRRRKRSSATRARRRSGRRCEERVRVWNDKNTAMTWVVVFRSPSPPSWHAASAISRHPAPFVTSTRQPAPRREGQRGEVARGRQPARSGGGRSTITTLSVRQLAQLESPGPQQELGWEWPMCGWSGRYGRSHSTYCSMPGTWRSRAGRSVVGRTALPLPTPALTWSPARPRRIRAAAAAAAA